MVFFTKKDIWLLTNRIDFLVVHFTPAKVVQFDPAKMVHFNPARVVYYHRFLHSVQRAIMILAKNGIEVNDEETIVILDFLYLMAKKHKKYREEMVSNPKEKSNCRKKQHREVLRRFLDNLIRQP